MVLSKVSAMQAAPDKMYVYIKDVVDELNLQRKLAKQMPIQDAKPKGGLVFTGFYLISHYVSLFHLVILFCSIWFV